MDSGNSGSISSSGDEEYDSRADHTLLPSTFLNHPNTHFGSTSISHPQPQQSSLLSSHHHSLFDLSSSYLHALSPTQPNSSNPNSFLNLDTAATSQARRSEPNCTDPANLPGVSLSSSSSPSAMNQCLFPPHGLGHCATDPSLQLRSVHDDDNNARVLSSAPTTNAARNSKKRTRASRRAPTTVLTTDTSNFRAMVQEFTGIPAPPFSGSSSFSRSTRRLDLLTGSSSSFRSGASHLDATASFYPLRPSPQKLHHPNPFVLSSSSSPSPSTLHNNNNMVDAIASTTNISSPATTNNNSINYQLPSDLGLPYQHHQQNIMLSMQNHPNLAFHPAPPLHHLGNHVLAGFGAKSPSLEDLGMSHGQVNNADLGASGVSMHQGHGQVTCDGTVEGDRRDPFRSLEWGYGKVASADGGSCKLNFSSLASASNSLNHEKTLENNSTTRGEGTTVDSWICSSD